MPLYGMWRAQGDLSVVIVEGEIDALSVSQAFKHKYAVVSLPNGSKDAAYNCQRYYEWLDGFKKIVLMFDQDEPGRLATEEAAAVLPIGKVCVAVLPRKDANEVLVKDGAAPSWTPSGARSLGGLTASCRAKTSPLTTSWKRRSPATALRAVPNSVRSCWASARQS
jgi:hypothetical protein